MKSKKWIMYLIIIFLILIIIFTGYIIIKKRNNTKEITEYTPQEEITEEQLRKTIVTLYFMSPNTGELMPEPRQIDVKDLIENPYEQVVKLLIDGPKNEQLVKLIPEGTKLNNANIEGGIVSLDLSAEFINEQKLGLKQEKLIINSIVNTLTELKEVNAVSFNINGEKSLSFPDNAVNFNNPFTREK